MTREQIENQEIWKKLKGAEKLFEVYTYFPSFHDAKIKNIDIGFADRSFCLTLDYYDCIDTAANNIVFTRSVVCWRNIREADFNWGGEELYGVQFSRKGELIKTKFDDYSSGLYGEIVAGEVEVMSVEVEPAKEPPAGEHVTGFSMR